MIRKSKEKRSKEKRVAKTYHIWYNLIDKGAVK